MNCINYFSALIFATLCLSWLLTNFVFKTGSGLDMSFFVFLLMLSFYRTKNMTGVAGTFAHVGLRPPAWRTLTGAAGLAVALVALSQLLTAALQVNLAEITTRQKSVGQIGYDIARAYTPLMASSALVIQSYWITFYEEFFFRGLLLRVIQPYHHLTAQLLQAGLFGFLHVAGSLGIGLAGNALAYLFMYPALAALLLGHFYLRTGHNLTLVWLAHFMVNTVSWLVYVNMGVII